MDEERGVMQQGVGEVERERCDAKRGEREIGVAQ